MPIRPIDLQTLFMQMSQVGRERAAEKEGAALVRSIQGAVEKQNQDDSKEAVRRPEEPEDGMAPVKEKQERKGASGKRQGKGESEEEATPPSPPEGNEEIIRDSSLGTKIDLSG